MLNNLRQGANVYVLEKSEGLSLNEGKIVSATPNIAGGIDIKVKVDEQDYDFKQVPYGQSIATYSNAIVSETKDGMLAEIAKLKETSEAIVDPNNIKYHERMIQECDNLLRQWNPSYDKEKKRDEEIDLLKKQMTVMSQSLSNIEKLLSNKND